MVTIAVDNWWAIGRTIGGAIGEDHWWEQLVGTIGGPIYGDH